MYDSQELTPAFKSCKKALIEVNMSRLCSVQRVCESLYSLKQCITYTSGEYRQYQSPAC